MMIEDEPGSQSQSQRERETERERERRGEERRGRNDHGMQKQTKQKRINSQDRASNSVQLAGQARPFTILPANSAKLPKPAAGSSTSAQFPLPISRIINEINAL